MDELETLRERLRTYDKDFEELIYAVSHDLRQPIVGILGFATILKEDLEPTLDPEHVRFLERVIDNAHKMDRILQSLLALSRAARVVDLGQEADVGRVLDEIVGRLSQEIRAAGVELVRSPSLPRTLRGVPSDVTQLFAQLIDNAVHFRGEQRQPRVEVGSGPELPAWPSHYHLWVRDNGMGIDPRYHDLVFQVFKKLSAADHARTGLGLAICRKIVDRYGGSLWLESELGAGATFHVAWPR